MIIGVFYRKGPRPWWPLASRGVWLRITAFSCNFAKMYVVGTLQESPERSTTGLGQKGF